MFRDWPTALVAVTWILALVVVVGRMEADQEGAAPAPRDAPSATADAPADGARYQIEFSDAHSGRSQQQFASGATIAYKLTLPGPINVNEVEVVLGILVPEGYPSVSRSILPVTPDDAEIVGSLEARDLIDQFGRGTYWVGILRTGEIIAHGVFQLESDVPQQLTLFSRRLPVILAAGEHAGFRFDEAGHVVETKIEVLRTESTSRALQRATFGGESYLFLTDEVWDGYWLVESDAVRTATD